MKKDLRRCGSIALAVSLTITSANAAATAKVSFDINAPSLDQALMQFIRQSGLQLMVLTGTATEIAAPRVVGSYTPAAALDQLLAGTSLSYEFTNSRTVAIRTASNEDENRTQATRVSTNDPSGEEQPEREVSVDQKGIPQILVKGSRSLNADIERTPDDIQPYVVFDRKLIERSGASNVEEFLRSRLTMNYVRDPTSESAGFGQGAESTIALRGLGSDQTLILIDGRRMASRAIAGQSYQPDLNTIPLSAIERIEVLPTTASGIYGGSATGGVVNVVLRRDYSGIEPKLSYEGTFDGGGVRRSVDILAGTSLGEKTSLLFAGTYSDMPAPLETQDRSFVTEGRIRTTANLGNLLTVTIPPLGATTNICRAATVAPTSVCNRNAAPLTLKDGTSLGSSITYVPYGYAGPTTDGGRALLSNAGHYNYQLSDTAQVSGGGRASLLNAPTFESMSTTLRTSLSSNIDTFIQLNGARNLGFFTTNAIRAVFNLPVTAPNNPFNSAIRVTVPAQGADTEVETRTQTVGALFGLIAQLPSGWRAEFDVGRNRTDLQQSFPDRGFSAAATTAVRAGQIDVMRDLNSYPVDFSQYTSAPDLLPPSHSSYDNISLRIGGDAFSLPAGPAKLSALLEYNREFDSEYVQLLPSGTDTYQETRISDQSRKIQSAYLELLLPLVRGRRDNETMLEAQVAGRYDHYRSIGGFDFATSPDTEHPESSQGSFDPTIGIRFRPVASLAFRASYGTGFLPPALDLLKAAAPVVFDGTTSGLTDPKRGGEPLGQVTIFNGGNPNLKPERSRSVSAGLVFSPERVADLRISFDWTRIRKHDNVTQIPFLQEFIDKENYLPGIIVRGPVAPGDAFGVGPIVSYQAEYINATEATVSAYDLGFAFHGRMRRAMSFDVQLAATRLMTNERQDVPTLPADELAGTSEAPEWSATGLVGWNWGGLSLSWQSKFLDGYWINIDHSVSAPQGGAARIGSTTRHDVSIQYRFGRETSLLDDLEIQGGVKNVFNQAPRYVATFSNSYDPWDSPLMATYFMSIRKGFSSR